MRALKIDPVARTVTVMDLNMKPASWRRGNISQTDKALRAALGLAAHYVVEPLPGTQDHRLILAPDQGSPSAGPVFHLQRDPERKFQGIAIVLGSDRHGFHTECRLAPLEVRMLLGFPERPAFGSLSLRV